MYGAHRRVLALLTRGSRGAISRNFSTKNEMNPFQQTNAPHKLQKSSHSPACEGLLGILTRRGLGGAGIMTIMNGCLGVTERLG